MSPPTASKQTVYGHAKVIRDSFYRAYPWIVLFPPRYYSVTETKFPLQSCDGHATLLAQCADFIYQQLSPPFRGFRVDLK